MNTTTYLLDAIKRFRKTLDEHQGQFECFDKHAIQVEGWLKGELAYFLEGEINTEQLDSSVIEADHPLIEADYPFGRKKVDCKLILNGTPVWIELKHFQVGYQGKDRWKASNYFGSKGIGIYHDVEKLSSITNGDKYIIVLATKNPKDDEAGDWEKGVNKFNERFAPLSLHIKSHTKPSDFPQSYFIGLLEVV